MTNDVFAHAGSKLHVVPGTAAPFSLIVPLPSAAVCSRHPIGGTSARTVTVTVSADDASLAALTAEAVPFAARTVARTR